MSRYNSKNKEQRIIALDRINTLFKQAKENFALDSKLSDRYVELARKIVMKYRIRMPSEFKRRYCKHCHKFLVLYASNFVQRNMPNLLIYPIRGRPL